MHPYTSLTGYQDRRNDRLIDMRMLERFAGLKLQTDRANSIKDFHNTSCKPNSSLCAVERLISVRSDCVNKSQGTTHYAKSEIVKTIAF